MNKAFLLPLLSLIAFALLAAGPHASPQEPAQAKCDNCSIAREVMVAAAGLKPGMTREQIEKEFQPDDTFNNGPIKRYVYRKCEYIKIDIDFDLVDPNAAGDNPKDRVVKISKPYIEQPFMD